jgi:hypothetical protein
MKSLKEKFGKFELPKGQVKAVKGGCVVEYCFPECPITRRTVCNRFQVACDQ